MGSCEKCQFFVAFSLWFKKKADTEEKQKGEAYDRELFKIYESQPEKVSLQNGNFKVLVQFVGIYFILPLYSEYLLGVVGKDFGFLPT